MAMQGSGPDALSAGEGGAGAWRLVPWTWRQGRTTAMWAARPGGTAAGGSTVVSGGMDVYLTRKPLCGHAERVTWKGR